jgi:hypothetical protein
MDASLVLRMDEAMSSRPGDILVAAVRTNIDLDQPTLISDIAVVP